METITVFLKQNSWLIPILVAWILLWKGLALWKAARFGHRIWFVVLLVVNTLGILDILYMFVFGKEKTPTYGQNIE